MRKILALALLLIAALIGFLLLRPRQPGEAPASVKPPVAQPAPTAPSTPATPPVPAPAPEPAPDAAAMTGSISGTVLRLDGVPAVGAKIRAAPGGNEMKRVLATAGPGGAFRFEELAPGKWLVACGGGGYATRIDQGAEQPEVEVVAGKDARVELRAQALAIVAGRVTGPDGKPVAEAKVILQCGAFSSKTGGVWRLEATSREDGSYEVTNATPGEFAWLFVGAKGFATVDRKLHDLQPGARVAIDVALEPAATLEMLLLAADDGSPIRKATVWVHDAASGHLYEGPQGDAFAPDPDGRVVVPSLKSGLVKVQIDAPGFTSVPDTAVDTATQAGPLTFRLSRGAAISGRVLRSDGTPMPKQWVHATPTGAEDPDEIADAPFGVSGEDGSFRIEALPPGRYRVAIFDDDIEVLASAEAEAGATDVVLRMEAGQGPRQVTVRLVDAEGKPIARAVHRAGQMTREGLSSSGGGGSHQPGETQVSLKQGLIAFFEAWDPLDAKGERLPLGHVFVEVPQDAPDPFLVRMDPEQVVTGRVLDAEEKPVEGAAIEVATVPGGEVDAALAQELGVTASGEGGAFRVRGLGKGDSVSLSPSAEGLIGERVTARAGASDVLLRLAPEVPCELRILDPDGKPVEGSIVAAFVPDDDSDPAPGLLRGTTDAAGKVRLRGLLPGRTYHLQVNVPSTHPDLIEVNRDGWTPGSGEIRLVRSLSIEGVVRMEPPGTPFPTRLRIMASLKGGLWSGSSLLLDAEGRFRITRLIPGTYEVETTGAGLQEGIEAVAGGPPVTLVLRAK